MTFIDIHCHQCERAGNILAVRNLFASDISLMHPNAYYSAGIHPWHVRPDTWEKQLDLLRQVALSPNILAIGECGLDKSVDIPAGLQHEVFEAQIKLAQDTRKPLIIHCVKSYSDMLAYRKGSNLLLPWIFHWFNSTSQMAFELIRKNCYLSFGHLLFNEKSKAFKVFQKIPPDRIFLETDDAGVPISQVYERAAAVRLIHIEKLTNQISSNFATCFHIRPVA